MRSPSGPPRDSGRAIAARAALNPGFWGSNNTSQPTAANTRISRRSSIRKIDAKHVESCGNLCLEESNFEGFAAIVWEVPH